MSLSPLHWNKLYCWRLALTCCTLALALTADAKFNISKELLNKIEQKYDLDAKNRVTAWQQLIATIRDQPETEQLKKVNDFFNHQVKFLADIQHWNSNDYWATPLEFLASGAGDCEDFSIAKYFTLRELGVDEKKLRLTYVKAVELGQAHMVLTYFAEPRSIPLVLDNLINPIKPATQRNDLLPVYSFNASGLWIAKIRGQGQKVGSSKRLSMWRDLKRKVIQNKI